MTYYIFPIYVVDQENARIQQECFDSFNQTTSRVDSRIIIVDNGSLFGLESAVRMADIYLRFPSPLGFAKAVNIGWEVIERMGDGDYIGVLNNDLTFLPGWMDGLLEHLDEKTAAVSPSDYPMEGINDHIWSSCFFQTAETRRKIGFFDDKELPFRYHDQDYWIRAKKLGLAFKRIGKNQVRHKESTTYKKLPKELTKEEVEKQIMTERHGTHMAQYFNER